MGAAESNGAPRSALARLCPTTNSAVTTNNKRNSPARRGPLPKGRAGAVRKIVPAAAEPQAQAQATEPQPQATEPQATEPQATQPQATQPQPQPQATEPQATEPQAQAQVDPMDAALARRQARLAELRAKREAADYIVAKLVRKPDKKVIAKGIGRKPIEWDPDLKLACDCAPKPIALPEYFPLRGQAVPGFFVRDPKNLDSLDAALADNISVERDDKLLTVIREFIAINIDIIEKKGAPISELIDMLAGDQPHLQSKMVWAGTLTGPQSILNQLALLSGRFAVLTPDGIVKLRKEFKTKN